jgi:hypothetical protein
MKIKKKKMKQLRSEFEAAFWEGWEGWGAEPDWDEE